MGNIVERKCRHCGNVYKYEKVSSYILLCPRCKKEDFFEPCYTNNGIVSCRIYLGDKIIGEMTSDNEKNYNIKCTQYDINERLHDSTNPYIEAGDILNKAFMVL